MKYSLIRLCVTDRDEKFSYYSLGKSDLIFPYYSQSN